MRIQRDIQRVPRSTTTSNTVSTVKSSRPLWFSINWVSRASVEKDWWSPLMLISVNRSFRPVSTPYDDPFASTKCQNTAAARDLIFLGALPPIFSSTLTPSKRWWDALDWDWRRGTQIADVLVILWDSFVGQFKRRLEFWKTGGFFTGLLFGVLSTSSMLDVGC